MLSSKGPVWGLVLAAGSGTRFGSEKQFVTIAGHRPVDLAVATVLSTCDEVVLVLPEGRAWDGAPVSAVITGGPNRPASVRRGLAAIPPEVVDAEAIVVVHQAANPLATTSSVEVLLAEVRGGAPAAVPGLRPADVVRRRSTGPGETTLAGELLGRDELVLVQTPAAFRLDVLRAAHARPTPDAQEDTALVTGAGHAVHVVDGDPRNVHVAEPADLELVEALLLARSLDSPVDRSPAPSAGDRGVPAPRTLPGEVRIKPRRDGDAFDDD